MNLPRRLQLGEDSTLELELPDNSRTPVPVVRIDVHRSLFVHRSLWGW